VADRIKNRFRFSRIAHGTRHRIWLRPEHRNGKTSTGPKAFEVVNDLAQRYGFSQDAVLHMTFPQGAKGRGGMAPVQSPEFAAPAKDERAAFD